MNRKHVLESVSRSLIEDIPKKDISSSKINPTNKKASIFCKNEIILCGMPFVDELIKLIDKKLKYKTRYKEGSKIKKNTTLLSLYGDINSILSLERVMLNYLSFLSAISTKANKYVEALGNKDIKILDTRKTIPQLRRLQKYAVEIGGCSNHRKNLSDAILIKENHIKAYGSISRAYAKLKDVDADFLCVEVENSAEFKEAFSVGFKRIMLDNWPIAKVKKIAEKFGNEVEIEVSGEITLNNINRYKDFNIKFISVGDLTKNISSPDMSLLIK